MAEKEEEKREEQASEVVSKSGVHGGHRKRILERVKKGDLCPHEYLEVLLFSALPRRNTNDLAHRLLSEFGDLCGVFQASVEQLMRVDGIGENVACFIRTIGEIMLRMGMQVTNTYPKYFTLKEFTRFMCREYGAKTHEVMDLYVLGANGTIEGKRSCSSMRSSNVEVQIPWLMQILIECNPAGIVLVHNHPNGVPVPSPVDNETTVECRSLCEKNGVVLCDHFIYSPKGIYSYNLGRQLTEKDLETSMGGGENAERTND